MINKLSIQNFKSIRELDLDCRRVNVFIGEPNAGKTNVLEALGLWCREATWKLFQVCRIRKASDLFFQNDESKPVTIKADEAALHIWRNQDSSTVVLEIFLSGSSEDKPTQRLQITNKEVNYTTLYDNDATTGGDPVQHIREMFRTKYFLFRADARTDFSAKNNETLSPPYGENLAALLVANREARLTASGYYSGQQGQLTVDKANGTLSLSKNEDGIVTTLPYDSASETLRRMTFYALAMGTHENGVLVFDEPEANSFPPYTKTLAERIALDDRGNQFFLTTHSPYMLDSLLSKTPAKDLNVVLCRMENFETKAYPLNQEQIDQIKEWSMDAFFNFDRLLPEMK